MKTAAGVPICGSTGSLIGRSVTFVLLSAVDADDAESVPAGIHCGRCALSVRPWPGTKSHKNCRAQLPSTEIGNLVISFFKSTRTTLS